MKKMVIEVSKDNFKKEVGESKIPVIIDFWAEWCGPCQMMKPVFEELSEVYKGKLKFAKVNVDEEGELASNYSVRGIPCLVIVNKGKEVDRIIGFMPKNELKRKIDKII